MAEGARLESVYTGNRIVGSNPTPSASAPPKILSGTTEGPAESGLSAVSAWGPLNLAHDGTWPKRSPLAHFL